MSIGKSQTLFCTLLCALSLSRAAMAQVPAPVPEAPSAAATVPPTPSADAPPATAPAPPPARAPQQVAVPPGYMLVPIPDASPQTRYDVQYPQGRGALPPGMELPYEEGDKIPDGYKLRSQPRKGLVIAGAIVTGVPWMFSVMAATSSNFDNKTGFLVVPVVGPWLALLAGASKDRECSTSVDYCSGDRSDERSILVLDGLMQTAGAAMFVAGVALPRKRLVREDVTVSVVPAQLGRDGYGLGAIGTF